MFYIHLKQQDEIDFQMATYLEIEYDLICGQLYHQFYNIIK